MNKPIFKPRLRYNKSAKLNSFKYWRNASSGFGNKAKPYVLERDGSFCANCGCTENLTIDHIISVASGFYEGISLFEINKVENLQILCKSCNCKKPHNTKVGGKF